MRKIKNNTNNIIEQANKELKHCAIKPHPLKNEYMVVNISVPFVPPYFGTLKECLRAAKFAEKSNAEFLLKNPNYKRGY